MDVYTNPEPDQFPRVAVRHYKIFIPAFAFKLLTDFARMLQVPTYFFLALSLGHVYDRFNRSSLAFPRDVFLAGDSTLAVCRFITPSDPVTNFLD